MSFRIRPIHDRTFSKKVVTNTTNDVQSNETETVEEMVFFVDEETGEISEEKQFVEKEKVNTSPQVTEAPKKESVRTLPLAMKKRDKVSFM
jgi:hypothetical protein